MSFLTVRQLRLRDSKILSERPGFALSCLGCSAQDHRSLGPCGLPAAAYPGRNLAPWCLARPLPLGVGGSVMSSPIHPHSQIAGRGLAPNYCSDYVSVSWCSTCPSPHIPSLLTPTPKTTMVLQSPTITLDRLNLTLGWVPLCNPTTSGIETVSLRFPGENLVSPKTLRDFISEVFNSSSTESIEFKGC